MKIGKLIPIYASRPWERIAIDIVRLLPLTNNNNHYLLTCINYFTKWPEAFPMPNKKTRTIAQLIIEQVFTRHGIPEHIVMDRGKQFVDKMFNKITILMGSKHHMTTAYHPQSDSLVERLN